MTNHEDVEWHREVITAPSEAALLLLRDASLLDRFYLAGGTGLALQFGHRLSQDLDFFAADLFDEESLLQRLQALKGFSLVAKAPHTLHTAIQGTRVTFLGYVYPVLFPFVRFVDLYVSARRFGLANILQWFDRKYAQIHHNKLHLLKSLTFFDDAEKDPMPHMLVPLDWEEVKRFFIQGVPPLM